MYFDHPCRRMRTAGFSLVELMVVIVIIGLLAGTIAIQVSSYLSRARQTTARSELSTIKQALDTFYGVYGDYPSNDQSLNVLAQPSEKLPIPPLEPGTTFKDPWGNLYVYNKPGVGGAPYDLVCLGADGRQGGDGINADISAFDLKE